MIHFADVPFVGNSKKEIRPSFFLCSDHFFFGDIGLLAPLFQFYATLVSVIPEALLWFVLGILRANSKEMRQSLLECIYNSVESKSGNMIVDCSTHDELIDLCATASYISGMQRE